MTRGMVEGLVLPLVRAAGGERYDYYVDSVGGSDSNDGLTPATAFATVEKYLSETTDTAGRLTSVGFRRGQRHLPASNDYFSRAGKWGGYGSGHMPFFDCSQPITSGDIEPHGTHSNVYVVEVTHAVALHFPGAPTASNGPHVGMWLETSATGILGQYLTPVFNAANVTAAEQFVKDNPGRCFVQKVGSSTMDVRSETSGTVFRYVFQLADSSDPRSGGTMRYACYRAPRWAWTEGAEIEGLAFGRCTGKDGTSSLTTVPSGTVPLATFRNCVWVDPGCHAHVGPSHWQSCYAISRTLSRSNGAGGWNTYTGVFEPQAVTIYDSFISGFRHGIYCHGAGQTPYVIQGISGKRVWIDNCQTAITLPTTAVLPDFEWFKITETDALMWRLGKLHKFTAQMRAIGSGQRRSIFDSFNTPAGIIEDGVVKFPQSTACWITEFNSTQAQAEALGSPTLRRVVITPHPEGAAVSPSTQNFINYVFEDVVGVRTISTTDQNSARLLYDATMSNSYIGPTSTGGVPLFANLAAYQAKVPGVGNDVVMFDQTNPVTFAGDPLIDPTITGPAEILGLGMGVDPAIVLALPGLLANVPTLQSTGFAP